MEINTGNKERRHGMEKRNKTFPAEFNRCFTSRTDTVTTVSVPCPTAHCNLRVTGSQHLTITCSPTGPLISTIGQLDLCCCWNLGWYGSNIRILPHRLKNSAMAAIHKTSTSSTIRASSARTTMGEFPPAPSEGGETEGDVASVGATAGGRRRVTRSPCSGNSVLLKFLISF